MIDIQDHIRNRNALNLFDGKGIKEPPVSTERKFILPIKPIYWRGHMVVSAQKLDAVLVTEPERR